MGFKPKDSAATRVEAAGGVEFDEGRFLEDVVGDGYLLAIGSEVVMNRDLEPSGDVKEYLRKVQGALLRDDADGRMLAMLDNGVDLTRWMLNGDQFSYDIEDMDPGLVDLMRTRAFRHVLTTTYDGYVEALMRQVWADEGLVVASIGDEDSLGALRQQLTECRRRGVPYDRPTLIYLFGKAVADEGKRYVRNDDDAIRIIERWMRMCDDDPVMQLLREKRLLALGCKFDDWYFRFFWYVLRRDRGGLGQGEVAITLDVGDRSERQLDDYLRRSRVRQHGDARLFMQRLTEMLGTKQGPLNERLMQSRRRGGVFISYCSRDLATARRLFLRLRDRYNVWFDAASLAGGDNYDLEIADAIASARAFVPLLSPTVAEDLAAGNVDNYYNREWRMAAQMGDTNIIPLAVNGYDLHQPYHTQAFERVVGQPLSGIDLMKPDGMERLMAAIDKALNITKS